MNVRWVRRLLRRRRGEDGRGERRLEREIEQELGFHLEMRTRENLAAGMSPEEACRRARERFGEFERVHRQGCDIRRQSSRAPALARLYDGLGHDLRFAARGMARSPGFTAVALIALALGIGASTAVFSVVDALLLDAFPYEDADRLVNLLGPSISRETMPAFRENLSTLEALTFYGLDNNELVGPEGARDVGSVSVDESFLAMLGVRPALGRAFGPDDFAADAADVVLISDPLWRDSFAADSGAIGSTLTIDGRPQTVIGVLPVGYGVVNYTTDLLMPLRDGDPREAIGLLRPDVTFEQGRIEAEGLAATFGLPPGRFAPLYYRSLYEMTVGGERPGVLLLAGAVALVMLIACANVANLLLARSFGRRAEISMRAALGASRGRLVRQLIAESGLLALCGGTLGVLAAVWALPGLLALSPPSFAQEGSIVIDLGVLGFALLLSLVWDPERGEPGNVWLETVSANYLELMDIAILRGRGLRDSSTSPEIIVSEEAARNLWPAGEPLGKRVTVTDRGVETDFLVVGVAADIRRLPTDLSPRPLVWVRFQQAPDTGMSFVIGARVPPEQLAGPVRELIARLDPELPALNLRMMDAIVYDSMRRPRFYISLIGAFGGIAVLLAAIGFYGVMAYAVGRRTHELGVRVALGASAARLRWMVVRQGVMITAIGIALGLAGCLALTRVVESFLYGTSPTDPLTYGLLVTIVAAVGLAACYVPARRATRVDPLTALRAE